MGQWREESGQRRGLLPSGGQVVSFGGGGGGAAGRSRTWVKMDLERSIIE